MKKEEQKPQEKNIPTNEEVLNNFLELHNFVLEPRVRIVQTDTNTYRAECYSIGVRKK